MTHFFHVSSIRILVCLVAASLLSVKSAHASINSDINNYFVTIDDVFGKVADAGALRSTNLKPAEQLFIRMMRKNQSFHTFIRTNSKGMVISEVIRGEKVERPMRSVADQSWFSVVSERKKAYYSLVKDDERGRYYLFWSRPIIKQGNRFVGAVMLKIDLWDCFYEFSNSTYTPFLVKIKKKSLFSHKWNTNEAGIEESLDIQGVEKISVLFSADKKVAPAVASSVNDSTGDAVFTVVDTSKKPGIKPASKKGTSGVLIFFLVVLILGVVGASVMLIAWIRKHTLMRHVDNKDEFNKDEFNL